MKRYQLLVLHVVALFALAGCSNDDITQDKGTLLPEQWVFTVVRV